YPGLRPPCAQGSVGQAVRQILWEGNAERASAHRGAPDFDTPAVMIANPLDDRETESTAAGRAVGPKKALEDARQVFRADAAPGIRHRQHSTGVRNLYEATLGILDGVADQIREHEAQRLMVQVEHGATRSRHSASHALPRR